MKKNFTFAIIFFVFFWIFFGWEIFEKIFEKNNFINTNFEQEISDKIVQIETKKWEKIISRSTGYKIENFILTSLHGVRDDSESIWVDEKKWRKIFIDEKNDIAILLEKMEENQENVEKILKKYFEENTEIWEKIFAYVWRNDKIHTIEGIITQKNTEIAGYNEYGKIQKIFIKNLTDLEVNPWDSGAPIFNEQWKIVDIVHIAK